MDRQIEVIQRRRRVLGFEGWKDQLAQDERCQDRRSSVKDVDRGLGVRGAHDRRVS